MQLIGKDDFNQVFDLEGALTLQEEIPNNLYKGQKPARTVSIKMPATISNIIPITPVITWL